MDALSLIYTGPMTTRGSNHSAISHEVAKGLSPQDINGTLDFVVKGTGGGVNARPTDILEPPPLPAQVLPGERLHRVVAPPSHAWSTLVGFFETSVPAAIKLEAWGMKVTAFVDYVAIGVKVSVYKDIDMDNGLVIAFQHTPMNDIIRFGQLCSSAIRHLEAKGLQVVNAVAAAPRGGLGITLEEDFEDELLEEDWPTRLGSALEAVGSTASATRELGLQMLANWAANRPECRPALAKALSTHSDLLAKLLRQPKAPLAEMYPLAVAMKFASSTMEDAAFLAGPLLLLLPSSGFPPIVAEEFGETYRNLQSAIVMSKCSAQTFVVDDSTGSTCCPPELSSSSSVAWADTNLSSIRRLSTILSQEQAPAWAPVACRVSEDKSFLWSMTSEALWEEEEAVSNE
uniref:Uncharacterized protein n=1 Tax=Pyrodinium bahamense TaxID=73915 RepID=A0A7S0FFU9_9DINO